jgi:uncharacterized protein (TIGR02145 family)
MKNLTTKFLLVSAGLTVAVCAQAQQRVVAPAGQAYTIQSVAPANGTSVTYQWFRDGVVIANETSESYTIPANLAKMANGLAIDKTFGTTFQRIARSADCMGGVAMSNTVVVYFCELLVNGVCWAKGNVDGTNRSSGNPWDLGAFYQWNRPDIGWASTGAVSGWNSTPDNSSTWTNGNPCPEGWRLPTKQDFQNLINGSTPVGGTWINNQARGLPSGAQGRLLGYNTALCTMTDMAGCIFLPTAGWRNSSTGAVESTGYGEYWSSEQASLTTAYHIYFNNSNAAQASANPKGYGFLIRCVQDVVQ